jgi:hypothetical protein
MPINKKSRFVSLDWDDVSIVEAKNRFKLFCETLKPVKASLSLSPLKGYHVRAEFEQEIDNWKIRQSWEDDPNRLMYEILRIGHEPDKEFLWNGKLVPYNKEKTKFVRFEEVLLYLWEKGIFQYVS